MSKKRYIVCLKDSTAGDDKVFISKLKESGFGWWHWFAHTWLIADNKGKASASTIRDLVRKVYPTSHVLVFELSQDADTWSGFGTKTKEKDMFKWLKENWKKP
jgi:hypothetical protein